ncbi:hypothetical protein H2203_002898 [Taxawa tesnikishii (nom. ined.)]|nr:hypothetical protein H2203_002898 [Dothideales sp. JES 119]
MENEKKQRDAVAVNGEKAKGKPDTEKRVPARILRYDEVFDLRTYEYKLIKTAKPANKLHNKKPVLVVRRIIDSKGRHVATEVDIKSQALAEVLIEINRDVEGLSLRKTPAVADPSLFFHSRFALRDRLGQEKARNEPDHALVTDISTALEYIQADHGGNIENFDSLVASKQITWDLMWALLAPNCLLYHWHELTEQHQVLLCRSIKKRERMDRSIYWHVQCDIVADDGIKFGMAKEPLALEIDEYEGARNIEDLSVFPLSFAKDPDSIRKELIARGKKYVAMAGRPVYWEVSGQAMTEKMNEGFDVKRFKFTTYGRAMADAAAFRTWNPNVQFIPKVHKSLESDSLTDDQYLIVTPVALGFSFGNKKWGGLPVSGLSQIAWGDEAFRSLVIDPKVKTLVHSLVKQHSTTDTGFDDVVKGKGKGLIGLLNGNPGCGKTLTAEAVAEITKRPLYAVSAGELGVSPAEVDNQLTLILELAHRWQAVLLLDESDVFMQERDMKDVKRNALVSIFLRQLEYFKVFSY